MTLGLQNIPFDLAAADRMEGWRERFAWPLTHDAIYRMGMAVARDFVTLADEIDDPYLSDVFTLIGPIQLTTLLSLLETALWVQHCEDVRLQMVGGPKEVYALRGDTVPSDPEYTKPSTAYAPPLRNSAMRRLARTASWTPWHRLPATVLAPTSTAISHNGLLRSFARESRERIDFRHADTILDLGRRRLNGVRHRPNFDSVVDRIKKIVERRGELDEQLSSTVMRLFAEKAQPIFEGADDLVCAARSVSRLPQRLWAGTGGYRPARALRIETRRRGGIVTGFDHSGSSGFIREIEGLALNEFSVSDRFVATTSRMAEIIKKSGVDELLDKKTEIIGAHGDPTFSSGSAQAWAGPHGPHRVLYVSGAYIGFRQRYPARIPDVLQLDWQLRLAETLNRMPVDLLAQMHPGGLMRGKVHPVGQVAKLSNRIFEDVSHWADVFVFDVVQSTTFTLALCTDRPIVLIDHGMNRFGETVLDMLRRRCTILTVTHDDRNRPQVDEAALEEALCGTLHRADPTEFRGLFAGEFA